MVLILPTGIPGNATEYMKGLMRHQINKISLSSLLLTECRRSQRKMR